MPMESPSAPEPATRDVWILTAPHWLAPFMGLSVVISFVPFILGFVVGLSVSSDVVFGAYALISGTCAHLVLQYRLHRRLLIWRKPAVPFVYFWVLVCLYVMIAAPFSA